MEEVGQSQSQPDNKELDADADSKMYSSKDNQLKKNEESGDIEALQIMKSIRNAQPISTPKSQSTLIKGERFSNELYSQLKEVSNVDTALRNDAYDAY